MWEDALRAMSRPSFDYRQGVRVNFLAESGIDDGGPSREFFDIALREMANDHTIFHGSGNRLSFVHNVKALGKRRFYFAGLFIGVSLSNGGPGFPCLAQPVFQFLQSGQACNVQVEVEDVPDEEIKGKLQDISAYNNLF